MSRMSYTDSCVALGEKLELSSTNEKSTVSGVLESMDTCGIGRALVRHAAGREYDPRYGNDLLLSVTAKTERLLPVATLAPLMFAGGGRADDPERLRRYLAEHRFCGAVLYPSAAYHNYSIADWCAGAISNVLGTIRLPLFIGYAEIGPDSLSYLLTSHPKVPIVLCEVYYGADRLLFPLFDRHENLYVVSTIDRQYRGIENYIRRFGAGRIVFGSNFPQSSMGASVASIDMSDVGHDEKLAVASGNIERLLEGISYA